MGNVSTAFLPTGAQTCSSRCNAVSVGPPPGGGIPAAHVSWWVCGLGGPRPQSLAHWVHPSHGVCMRHGDLSVPRFSPSLSHPWHPGTCQQDPALSTMSSMSPESFVSSVVHAHLCVHVFVRRTQESCSISVLCGQMKVGLFLLSLCFSLSFFLFPPHPHRTLPSTQTLISQISEKVGPFHFLSIYSSPIDGMLLSVGTRGLNQVPLGSLQPYLPTSWALPCVVWASRRAGPGVGGQAPLPCMFLWLGSPMHLVPACPFSWAALLGWLGMHGAWHTTAPYLCAWARPAVCSRWHSGGFRELLRPLVLCVYLWGLLQTPTHLNSMFAQAQLKPLGRWRGKANLE